VKTRAELIEILSNLQMDRLEGNISKRPFKGEWTPKIEEEHKNKSYFRYHDGNCEESTRDIKDRIAKELIWKIQMENRHGTTNKV
jgi:hypothetical protein